MILMIMMMMMMVISTQDIPMFYSLFNSTGDYYRKDRGAMLSLLACSIKHSDVRTLASALSCVALTIDLI